MSKVYEIVQDKIVKQIEEAIANGGTAPWRKPWKGGIPKNYITKKPYRGINLLLLDGGSYLTFKQIQDLKKKNPEVNLKKGSKSDMVVFWTFVDKSDEDNDEDKSYGVLKYYRVFHISNVEGIEEEVITFDTDPIEVAENLVSAYKVEVPISIRHSGRAYYVPSLDKIVLPTLKQFENSEEFYSVAFHEMVHSTGHETRLNRFKADDQTQFGSASYSKEELVAEIGANMILSTLGIECEDQQENSISYLYGWLKKLKSDPKFITQAAQQAQKASDFILEFQEGTEANEDSKRVVLTV